MLSSNIHNKKFIVGFILIIYTAFGLVSILQKNQHFDEINSHIPTLELFVKTDPLTAIQSHDYKSASTPIPYIIASIPFKVLKISPGIISVRLINILVSVITLFLFLKMCVPKTGNVMYPTLILFFYPYFIKPSFLFFMSIYGLLFFILFLLFVLNNKPSGHFLGGLSLSLAILSQQFYIVPFLLFTGLLLFEFQKANFAKEKLKLILLFILPITLCLFVFIAWGSLTHPNYQYWGINFQVQNITSVLIILASALGPFIVFNIAKINKIHLVLALSISFVLVVFASPEWVNEPTVGGISGYTFHLLAIIGDFSTISSAILKVILCSLGILSLAILFNKTAEEKRWFMYLLFLSLVVGFCFNKLPSERHLLPLIAVAYLLAFNVIKDILVFRVWAAFQIIIGTVYFYYIMFIYSSQQ